MIYNDSMNFFGIRADNTIAEQEELDRIAEEEKLAADEIER